MKCDLRVSHRDGPLSSACPRLPLLGNILMAALRD